MDIETLQERQRWTLEQKIDHAVATVEAYIARTGKTPYYCELYNKGAVRTGCMFCGFGAHLEKPTSSRFAMLYDLHPKAYEVFMRYENNGITYREALRAVGVVLPDEYRQLELFKYGTTNF